MFSINKSLLQQILKKLKDLKKNLFGKNTFFEKIQNYHIYGYL